MQREDPKRLPRVLRHLSGLRGELCPPKATLATGTPSDASLKLFTRCFGHKVAAAHKCRREAAPRGNSHRLPSVLNPPVRRNKVCVSGGYLTPVITERPTLHWNTHRHARVRARTHTDTHTHTAAAAASCFLLLSLSVTAEIDNLCWNVWGLHLATRSTNSREKRPKFKASFTSFPLYLA